MRNNTFWGAVLSAALALGVAGCSSDDGGGAAGSGGSGGVSGSGGMAGEGGTGGGMPAEIHGCTFDAAIDMTGMAAVNITDSDPWAVPHNACIRVSVGTEVTWNANFTAHPLVGGITPTADASSPITAAGANTGIGDAAVTFDAEGTYPYFCEIHINSMFGVIYVVP